MKIVGLTYLLLSAFCVVATAQHNTLHEPAVGVSFNACSTENNIIYHHDGELQGIGIINNDWNLIEIDIDVAEKSVLIKGLIDDTGTDD